MLSDRITVTSGLSAEQAKEQALVLASHGIEAVVDFERPDVRDRVSPSHLSLRNTTWCVTVAGADEQTAREILSSEQEELGQLIHLSDRQRRPDPALGQQSSPHYGFYWVVAIGVVNFIIWWLMEGAGGSTAHATLLRFGAITTPLVLQGQWWRTVTAIFLHIGARHLIGNTAVLLVLGGLALQTWGPGRLLFLYVLSGVFGNWAGIAFGSRTALKAGASGAILGLLGALAGARLREIRQSDGESRFKSWHVVAMLVAFYGMVVGVRPNSDHVAHIGGLIGGALITALWPRPGTLPAASERRLQLGLGAIATMLCIIAGTLAATAQM